MQGVSISEMFILAVAVSFLVYAFTGSARLVGVALFAGALGIVAVTLLTHADRRPDGRAVDLASRDSDPSRWHGRRGETTRTGLFGVKADARRVAYLLDVSPSMAEGGKESPLALLKEELKQSVNGLKRGNLFQIIAYDHIPRSLVSHTRSGLVTASNHYVTKAFEAIDALTASEKPEPFEPRYLYRALHKALSLQPDVIYFLTDGRGPPLSSAEMSLLKRHNRCGASIHVIQLHTDAQAAQPSWLNELAYNNVGAVRRVSLQKKEAEEPAKEETVAEKKQPSGGRPSWVDEPTPPVDASTGSGVYRLVVATDPCKTERRCRDAMDRQLIETAVEYVDRMVGEGRGQKIIKLDYLWNHVVEDTYIEKKVFEDEAIGEMRKMYAKLAFDEKDAKYFQEKWQERLRIGWVAVAGLFLAFVGAVFTYLKIDTATRGYYSGRLKLATLTIMVVLAGLGATLARHYDLL